MPSKRKFYHTVIQVEVLSEEPYEPASFERVVYDITEGDCSGSWEVTKSEEIDGPTTAKLLLEQESDPSYFRLTEDGEEESEDT